MPRRFLASTAFCAALALTAPALAQDTPSADTVLATVGETKITLGHMLALRRGLPQELDRLPDDELFNGLLDQLEQQTLLMSAHEGELSLDARVRLENERRAILAADVIRGLLKEPITDEALNEIYTEIHPESQTEYRAAHILLETEEAARMIIDEIEGGANFAALAQEHSIGPSGPSGGDLGWFGDGVMVPEFFDAVAALGEGGISEPLETRFGWHVIQLRETRFTERPSLAEARDDLVTALRQEALRDYMAELRQQFTVSRKGSAGLDPAVINRIDLLEN